MKNVKYEKPSMKFVDLHNEQAIAANGPCLGAASGNNGVDAFYYDVTGYGWLFIRHGGNCNANDLDQFTFTYQQNPDYEGESASQENINAAIEEAKASLQRNKQEFTGAYVTVQPSWS